MSLKLKPLFTQLQSIRMKMVVDKWLTSRLDRFTPYEMAPGAK
jgi:hypothetical protein